MKRLLMIMTTAAATMSFAAVPAWAQFNNNGGNNVAGTDYIDPANVTGSATEQQTTGYTAEDASNGSNMDGDYLVATTQVNGRGQWHSLDNAALPHTIRWQFDQNYDLRDMWLWNGNPPGHSDRGIRDVEVWTSADGSSFSQLTSSYIFTRAPASNPYNHDMDENRNFCAGCNEVNLGGASLAAVELRMIKPIGESNYGAQLFVVEEVRFNIGEGVPGGEPLDFTWNVDSFGEWTTANPNWTPTGGPPGDPGAVGFANHTATFGSAITSNKTVSTETAVSVRAITFDNVNTYNIAGTGSVNLIAPTGAGLSTQITGVQGTHQFQAAVNLHTDTTVNIASDSTLIFNNALDLNSNVLTKTGAGTLAIRNDLLTSGGTINCSEGTCSGSGTISGDLNNDGGTISPGNSSSGQSVVPEPTTLLLVMIGAMGMFAFRRSFRRKE